MHSLGLIGSSKLTAKAVVIALVAGLLGVGLAVSSQEHANAAACSASGSTNALYSGVAGQDGSSSTTAYRISTAADLIRISNEVPDWTGKYFLQTADIDLGGCEWTPIGNSATKFSGHYDGGGFSISGLKLSTTASDGIGLFGDVWSGSISNLKVIGTIASSRESAQVGGIVGLAHQTTTVQTRISKVRSEVDFNTSGSGVNVGGIVGHGQQTTLDYSVYSGTITMSANRQVGGLVGFSSGGTITGSYSLVTYGFVGITSTFSGGISGWGNPVLNRGYTVPRNSNAGIISRTATLNGSSFWDSTVGPSLAAQPGYTIVNAVGKTTAEMKSSTTYRSASWDIVDGWETFSTASPAKIWGICSAVNDGYPFLLWEYTSNPCTSAPGAPTISAVTAGNGQLSVAFTAPGSDGGASITNYDYSIDDGANWVTPSTPSTTSPVVITGLTNATAYPVKIRARNSVGGGTASNSVSGTPVAPSSSSGSGSSGSVYVAPVVVPEVVQVVPSTIRQPTIRQATDDKPARLLGRSLDKDVLFIADSARLSPEAKKSLRQAVRLAMASDSKVAVTGFAAMTNRGRAYEKSVAQKRALAVASYLRAQGFDDWIYYQGLSGRQGLAFDGDPRRVEIRILK